MKGRVALLGVDGESTRVVHHYLAERFPVAGVILESPVSRRTLLSRRAKRLGLARATGQAVFSAVVAPALRRAAKRRIAEIYGRHQLSTAPLPEAGLIRVQTVNDDPCRAALVALAPDVVVINGTRIIGKATLDAVPCRFVNMHAGLTPRYRGVHGAYWALAEGRPDDAGVTVHFVDEGIDTGEVLAQAQVRPGPQDNFATYPVLQLAAGLPLLVAAIEAILEGRARTRPPLTDGSKLWYHPTAVEYLSRRVFGGVR